MQKHLAFGHDACLRENGGGLRSTREYIDYLAGLPVSQNIDGVMLVAHDNLANPGNGFYMKPNETEEEIHSSLVNMQEEGVSVGFFAHTHTPRVYVANERDLYDPKLSYPEEIYEPSDGDLMMFNVGSVGQPRDNDPRACYVLVYCEDNQVKAVEYRRVEYNVEKTASQLRRSFIDRFIRRKGTETLKINYRFKMGEYETTIAKILIDRLRAGR